MQSDPWVGGQPVPDGGMLVGAVVVEHHMELSARVGAGDELEEGQELGVSMPVKAAAGDLAGGDLQGGEQAGDAVPDIIVGAPLGQPRAQRQGGAVRSSAWIWDFSSTQSMTAPAGGSRYRAHRSVTLASSSGSVENLNVWTRCGARSWSAQIRATVMRLTLRWPARVRVDQCVIPRSAGRAGQGDGDDLGPASIVDDAGSARAGLVVQPAQTVAGIAATPAHHGLAGAADLGSDLGVGMALGRQQHDPGPHGQPSWHRRGTRPATKRHGIRISNGQVSGGWWHARNPLTPLTYRHATSGTQHEV
jgi:hypothetical protein